jgi:hypothetical protein
MIRPSEHRSSEGTPHRTIPGAPTAPIPLSEAIHLGNIQRVHPLRTLSFTMAQAVAYQQAIVSDGNFRAAIRYDSVSVNASR